MMKMLASLTSRATYTCICRGLWKQSAGITPSIGVLGNHKSIHTKPACCIMDKDVRGKDKVLEEAGRRKSYQPMDDPLNTENDAVIEGLNSGGILTPSKHTPNMVISGTKYSELHFVSIKSTPNNTILSLQEHKGTGIAYNSCGIEGFKNSRKGTNIAAQAAAITLGKKALEKGVRDVKIIVKGLGPGRLPAIKGLQMAGLNVVSITDNTPIRMGGGKSRKVQRK
ncbi:unnamed protein product [Owenia fusiformis]|uniref:Mitochondrial ribosomal protein S11 n=1 Tax=Owenia fusiformis TaxID=6347 RepID=A0A8S4PSI6_OWEFU|nr:unnamed protein product [Owenia fusiformis]